MDFKLNPEFKARWVAALRSGKYTQGRGLLRGPENTFCCLGVAADVCDPGSWSRFLESSPWAWKQAHEGALPKSMIPHHVQQILYRMNDQDGATFAQIADWIEANL